MNLHTPETNEVPQYMHFEAPISSNDLDNLFGAIDVSDAPKLLELSDFQLERKLFRKPMTPQQAASFFHRHIDVFQRYVLDAGKGWGSFDRKELTASAERWKKTLRKSLNAGSSLKRELSVMWGRLEQLDEQRQAAGCLEGVELAEWRGLNKKLRLVGFRFVSERIGWQTTYRSVLQIVPAFQFDKTFPQANPGEFRPKLYLCRDSPLVLVGEISDELRVGEPLEASAALH